MAARRGGGGIWIIILRCANCCGIYGDGRGPGSSGCRRVLGGRVGHIRKWLGLEMIWEMREFQMPGVECVCLLLWLSDNSLLCWVSHSLPRALPS